mmetsp:Transcript_13993/g.31724  ORF Transcript_13993/g.31724 Transcript_13993/m.31724 type:complete len:760 (-) Transcript_13993:125-2404(-)
MSSAPEPTVPGQANTGVRNGKDVVSSIKPPPYNLPTALEIQSPTGQMVKDDSQQMFVDHDNLGEMRQKVLAAISKPVYSVHDFYHDRGFWQRIAKSQIFENLTLMVIFINAIWMWIDTDFNDADTLLEADLIFQVAEHFFCVYFSFEWFVRFMSFRRKRDGMGDGWFMFDTCLVSMMVMETWVMTVVIILLGGSGADGLGNASILRLFRLLRLSRLARMLRSMPELMILIKGMVAAGRSVFFTLCLLALLLYIFSIAFTQLTEGEECGELYFKTIPASMHTLLIVGTFLDNLGPVMDIVKKDSLVFGLMFLVFIALAALMVMNMLIGVLCEVVSGVATAEKEDMMISFVKTQLRKVVTEIDKNHDDSISEKEFDQIVTNKVAIHALVECGVDPLILIDMKDLLFQDADEDDEEFAEAKGDEEKTFKFSEFLDLVLQLRGSNRATVKDMVDLRKYLGSLVHKLEARTAKRTSRMSFAGTWTEGESDSPRLSPQASHPENSKAWEGTPTKVSPQLSASQQPLQIGPTVSHLSAGTSETPSCYTNNTVMTVNTNNVVPEAALSSEDPGSGANVVAEQSSELIGFLTADLHELNCLLELMSQHKYSSPWQTRSNRQTLGPSSPFYAELQQRVMRLEQFLSLTITEVNELRAALPPLSRHGATDKAPREAKVLRAWMASLEANFLTKSVSELQDLASQSAGRGQLNEGSELWVQVLEDGEVEEHGHATNGRGTHEELHTWLLRAQSQVRDALSELYSIRERAGK